jgi:hypothetical protein
MCSVINLSRSSRKVLEGIDLSFVVICSRFYLSYESIHDYLRIVKLLERMTLEEKVAQMDVLMGSGMGGLMGELMSSMPQEELEAG